MKTPIVHAEAPILLLGGGNVSKPSFERLLPRFQAVVCADGGANTAQALGVTPAAVIGDMDSVSDTTRAATPPDRWFQIPEQDSTDFDKCLRHIEAPLVLGLGFEGSRLDHQLAALNTLSRHPDRRCILIGADQIVFLAPPAMDIELPHGCLFSLFPLAPVQGGSQGLRWPIDEIAFAPDTVVGTSNEVVGPVSVTVTAPKMLVILPLHALDAAIEMFLGTNACWPVRDR
mgnify:CR=1 FL=1